MHNEVVYDMNGIFVIVSDYRFHESRVIGMLSLVHFNMEPAVLVLMCSDNSICAVKQPFKGSNDICDSL